MARAVGAASRRPARTLRAACVVAAASLSLDDLLPPPIDGDLRSLFEEAGATLDERGVALSFGDDEAALEALGDGMLVFDRSHWGRARVAGAGALPFLQAQLSADLRGLRPGGGVEALLLRPDGAVEDVVTLLATAGGAALLLLSPGASPELLPALRARVFPADGEVVIADVADATCAFALVGPATGGALERLGAGSLAAAPRGSHALFAFDGSPVVVAAGCGLASGGVTLVCDEAVAGALWAQLTGQQLRGVPAGEAAWERLRIAEGRPARGAELSGPHVPDATPLEAALAGAVSLAKGCFPGREALAEALASGPPRRSLMALRMPPDTPGLVPGAALALAAAQPGAPPVGVVTSAAAADGTGLAYVAAGVAPGTRVLLGGVAGVLVEPACAQRALAADAPAQQAAADDAAEAARKAAKLAAMAARLEAYEAAQKAAKAQQ